MDKKAYPESLLGNNQISVFIYVHVWFKLSHPLFG
jgi:hypothetical protein